MLRNHCYVCNDARKHRMKVDDLRRITSHMRMFAIEQVSARELDIRRNDDLRRIMRNLDYDKPSVHYMCGHCVKVNSIEIDREYEVLKETYMKLVVSLLKTKDEQYFSSVKYRLKRLFSGYLPRYARSLDMIVFKPVSEAKTE